MRRCGPYSSRRPDQEGRLDLIVTLAVRQAEEVAEPEHDLNGEGDKDAEGEGILCGPGDLNYLSHAKP